MASTNLIKSCGIHMYQYVDMRGLGRTAWMCGKGCGHFLPRNVQHTIIGRMSLCWYCQQSMKLAADHIQQAIDTDGKVRHIDCIIEARIIELANEAEQIKESNPEGYAALVAEMDKLAASREESND